MNIKIITIHNIPNFGSVFQSYALANYIQSLGYDNVKIIDYNPSYFQKVSLKAFVGRIINLPHYISRQRKFRKFVEKNIPLTECRYATTRKLSSLNSETDLFISGGDQLWNVFHDCGHDDAYKLTWAKGKKISYATSLGQKNFSEAELADLSDKISDYRYISVRESSSVELLKKKSLVAFQCVDPVFLLSAKHYLRFVKPIKEKKYALVYLVTPSNLLNDCIEIISKKMGLSIILCSGFSKKCYCDRFYKDLGPDEILSYIYHADIVLSSSFHATSFSLMFEKQFFTILPNEHTNERIEDLLSIRGLTNRIITDTDNLQNKLEQKIDYSHKTDQYDLLIRDSKDYLLRSLKDAETD